MEKSNEKSHKWEKLEGGTKVKITGDHPHTGADATFIHRDKTSLGDGNLFERDDTGEKFFVFDSQNVKYK